MTRPVTLQSQAALLAASTAELCAHVERLLKLPQAPTDLDAEPLSAYTFKKVIAKATGCKSIGGSIEDYVAKNQGTVWAALREIAEQDAEHSTREHRGRAITTDIHLWRWLSEPVPDYTTRYQALREAQERTDYAAMKVLAAMWGMTCDEVEELAYSNYGRETAPNGKNEKH